VRIGLNGVPRGSDAGSFAGKGQIVPTTGRPIVRSITSDIVRDIVRIIRIAIDWVWGGQLAPN